ncbi:zinc finger CCCH domain-containing protein 16 [Cornus florida]|uniref:zinc finger CCCH domain-containing protein 16 n=1 Tax=Cornus florida TaxID=4283 RepID=UPI002899C5D7|nr:zinc finger CCCH domain-containing protein 16 [Cornus florida]
MAPRKELCRNFVQGSCQYGEGCRYLHATQQQSRPNSAFGFGMQTGSQFQRSNSQQQKPNPFGFGVRDSSQPRGANDFGSKQNQFKPFENKWTRSSPVNSNSSHASRQPDTQPPAAIHNCLDPESCKRQIIEDFQNERPLWKLTCYSHCRNASCDIVGDISYEELRASAYDDSKRGLSLQSIVERERNLLNSKLLEYESLLRNPYVVPPNSAIATQSPFSGATPNVSSIAAPKSAPPSVSSFSQLNASPNTGFGLRPATPPNNVFGQSNSFQNFGQTSSTFGTNNVAFGNAGSLGGQLPNQSFGVSFASNAASFSNSASSAERNPFSTLTVSSQIPSGPNLASNAVGQSNLNVHTVVNLPRENGSTDDSVWLKEEWIPGEIPEEAPPDKFIF